MPRRPPSPLVVTTLGTLPTWVLVPDWVSLKILKESRSVTSADPSGSQLRPQGTVQPDETVRMAEGTESIPLSDPLPVGAVAFPVPVAAPSRPVASAAAVAAAVT